MLCYLCNLVCCCGLSSHCIKTYCLPTYVAIIANGNVGTTESYLFLIILDCCDYLIKVVYSVSSFPFCRIFMVLLHFQSMTRFRPATEALQPERGNSLCATINGGCRIHPCSNRCPSTRRHTRGDFSDDTHCILHLHAARLPGIFHFGPCPYAAAQAVVHPIRSLRRVVKYIYRLVSMFSSVFC